MREITLQELAALAENAKGEIRRIYLHWTAGHYNNTYDDYHLNITGDGTVWSSCGKLTEYKEHTWHRNSGAVMNRNHDPIVKATVIIVACIVATIMICVECALLPRYGWLWLVLLGLISTAIIFCVVTIVLAWRHGKGGRR